MIRLFFSLLQIRICNRKNKSKTFFKSLVVISIMDKWKVVKDMVMGQ